ncbi:MAG TPA: response regulator transcription factor [Acidimicrobiales bacterium]|jgi:two-component system NarL family response regulator|nr:response regulator transcription factor [Acidimicrobiales bacterium]
MTVLDTAKYLTTRSTENIAVLVADDDMSFRRVIMAVLSEYDDISVVAEAADGRQALAQCIDLLPDVVLLDVRMPGGGGIEAARSIHRHAPMTKIVMLTCSDDDEDVYQALKCGASGYVLKAGFVHDIASVVRALAQGAGVFLSAAIAAKLLDEFGQQKAESREPELSRRELEVLALVARGDTNDRIAEALCLSSHTVKRHVANILAKLHERTREDAVIHAKQAGVLNV